MPQFTVKQARQFAGKTQKQIAEEMGVCRDKYRKLEENPEEFTIKNALKFAAITHLSIDDISFVKNSTLSRVTV